MSVDMTPADNLNDELVSVMLNQIVTTQPALTLNPSPREVEGL